MLENDVLKYTAKAMMFPGAMPLINNQPGMTFREWPAAYRTRSARKTRSRTQQLTERRERDATAEIFVRFGSPSAFIDAPAARNGIFRARDGLPQVGHVHAIDGARTPRRPEKAPLRGLWRVSGFICHSWNAWWARQDLNLQPDRYERPALTIELRARPVRHWARSLSNAGRQGKCRPARKSQVAEKRRRVPAVRLAISANFLGEGARRRRHAAAAAARSPAGSVGGACLSRHLGAAARTIAACIE